MLARIFPNIKSSSQSGNLNRNNWILAFKRLEGSTTIDSIIGWTSSTDMMQEVSMKFNSKEEAESFAKKHNIEYELIEKKKSKIHLKSYADNFK